jgi:hypothetical protein
MDFIKEYDYQLASDSENPNEKCSDCECLMIAKNVLFCYVYEQSLLKNKSEFHPKKNYNCKMFSGTPEYYERTGYEPPDIDGIGYGMEIVCYEEALIKGVDPKTDSAYINALKESNDYYAEQEIDKELRKKMRKLDEYEFEKLEHLLENASKEEKSKILEKLREREKHEDNDEEDEEDWDDPNSYANCSDWEDEPENCFNCADDECPMNKS